MQIPNVIPDRIKEALVRFPPFSMLPEDDVRELARAASVRVLVPGEFLWKQGEAPGDGLFFLARGRVEYIWQVDGRNELVDVRDVGDVLGLSALMDGKAFRVSAQIVEESLFYTIPWTRVRRLLDDHDAARNYMRRHMFWGTRVGRDVSLPESMQATAIPGRSKDILQSMLDGAQVIRPRTPDRLLTCLPTDTIHRAAGIMSSRRVGSLVVVDGERRPVGIVTSSNLIRKVILGGLDREEPASAVMVSPVVTVSAGSSATAAILTMLRERIGQVCVTEDGSPNTPVLDVCSEKDLLTQSGHHPAGLLRDMRHARTTGRLRELCDDVEDTVHRYLENGVSAILLGQICAELFDELVQRLLEMATAEMHQDGKKLPDIPWAWMSVGSDGRREQILRTDMDNAFVFAATGDADSDEAARRTFLDLTDRVIAKLVECGFSRCQGGVMASNPRWCLTSDEWIAEINDPNLFAESDHLLRAVVLYDLRFVAGERKLCDQVRNAVFESVGNNLRLQKRLAEMVVATPPPLNFWGRFVVEKRGGREGQLDIKGRGLSPLRDAARVLALKYGLTTHYSTGGRWLDIQKSVPRLTELAGLARDSYETLLRIRNLTGLRRGDAGRYIEPAALSKLERSQLANVFDVLRMVQNTVKMECQLEIR